MDTNQGPGMFFQPVRRTISNNNEVIVENGITALRSGNISIHTVVGIIPLDSDTPLTENKIQSILVK